MPETIPAPELIEAELRQLRGVIAVRVVVSMQKIEEVHVLADRTRPAKQIVRDIEAACAARFNLDIDHRKISVAQIEASPSPAFFRLCLESVTVETGRDNATAVVCISAQGEKFTGKATGLAALVPLGKLAALAAINAVDNYMAGQMRLELTDFVPFRLAGWSGFVAVVSVLQGAREEKMIGCALLHRNEPEAGVKAVLDAINQYLPS
ncbi:MAG TPA: hypothetical protein GXX29_05740 [Firmicutes bacterium]|nr:hypothetical protein [Bacillota bacterium]